MLNYREFDAGPDPFGRKFRVLFKYIQNGISIRHADTVDCKFILADESGEQSEKLIALQHADVVRLAKESGRAVDDPWCARLATLHLLHLIATGEDIEKSLVTIPYPDLQRYAADLAREETAAIQAR